MSTHCSWDMHRDTSSVNEDHQHAFIDTHFEQAQEKGQVMF